MTVAMPQRHKSKQFSRYQIPGYKIFPDRMCLAPAAYGQQSPGKCLLCLPPDVNQSDLPEFFKWASLIAKKYIILSDEYWFKWNLFKNFPDYKIFPCSNATTLQRFLGLWAMASHYKTKMTKLIIKTKTSPVCFFLCVIDSGPPLSMTVWSRSVIWCQSNTSFLGDR